MMLETLLEIAKRGEPFTPEQMAEIKTLNQNDLTILTQTIEEGRKAKQDQAILAEIRKAYQKIKVVYPLTAEKVPDIDKMDDEKILKSYHNDRSSLLNEILAVIYKDEETSETMRNEVRDRLFDKNKGLYYYIIKRYAAKDDGKTSNDDLAQECTLAFFTKALPTFDVSKGYKFSTYVTTIYSNLMSTQHKNTYNKLRACEVSTETPIADDGGSVKTLLDYQVDPHLTPEEEFRVNEDKEILYDALNDLTLEQKFIAYCRYGLGNVPMKTQAEIADYMHMSQANVSKIEGIMRIKLKQALRARDF